MKDFIWYFYKIKIDMINSYNNYYSFTYNNSIYKLYIVSENINISFLITLDKRLLSYTLISEIIVNTDGEYISTYNNTKYILIKLFVNPNKILCLSELISFDYTLYIDNNITNWGLLWSKKIDYLEKLVSENEKKYPLIVNSFNYFVGMAENAISYYNSIIIPNNYRTFISHRSISLNNSIQDVYNPLNIIFDYIARDIGEYIKNSFFINNKNIFNELNSIINNLSIIDIKLIISRIMYPSFYFNLYEDILVYNSNEKILLNIINKLDNYEKYLSNIISYFSNYYNIDSILWLKKD